VELSKLYYSTYFFLYFSPFAKCNQPEMEKIVQEILQNEANHPDVIVLDIQSMPVLHHSMVSYKRNYLSLF
jgi:hypothetical protein